MERKLVMILVVWIFALSGCGTIRSVGPGTSVALTESEAIVFGKVIFIENHQEKIPYSMWTRPGPRMSFFHVESGKYIDWGFAPVYEKDGSFYWTMPTGTYIIPDIRFDYFVLPQIAFQIPSGPDAIYLGVLRIDVKAKQIMARHYVKEVNSITVEDEFDKAKEAFISRNPDFKGTIKKNLMIHDPSIPIDRSSYTQKQLLSILNIIGFGLLMTIY